MSKLRRFLVISLVISIAGAGLPQPAQAAMLATERAIATADAAAGAARERIEHAAREIGRGRGYLGGEQAPGPVDDRAVGEGAADVDADEIPHCERRS